MFIKKCRREDDDEIYFEIDFVQELSDGAMVFKIIDTEFCVAGHIVVSSKSKVTLIKSDFYEYTEEDEKYLNSQVQKFLIARQ